MHAKCQIFNIITHLNMLNIIFIKSLIKGESLPLLVEFRNSEKAPTYYLFYSLFILLTVGDSERMTSSSTSLDIMG